MKWRLLIGTVAFCVSTMLITQRVRAVTVTTSQLDPPSFLNGESRTLSVTVSTISSGSAYLKAVISTDGGLSGNLACSMGLNVTSFICDGANTEYPQITGSGTWSIEVKPNLSSSHYVPNGSFKLSVFRCTTSSCADASPTQDVQMVDTISPTPSPTVAPTPTPTPTVIPTPQPTNISLSEVVACPSPGGVEWVELHSTNVSSVNISGWKFQDNRNNSMTVPDSTIDGKGYKAFDVSGINFNNSGDTVRLLNGDGSVIESFSYGLCGSSQSWAKKSDGNWTQTPIITKGASNLFPTPTPTATPYPTLTPDPTTMEGAEVLGESTDSGNIPTFIVNGSSLPTASAGAKLKKEAPIFAILAIVLGLISIVTLGGYLWYDWKKHGKSIFT